MNTLYLLWYDGVVKRLWYYYLYLFISWGLFRYFVQLPVVIEELWFKPVLWLIPLFWWNISLEKRVVMFGKKWKESLVTGFGVGILYFLILKYKSLSGFYFSVDLVGIALATAITEELVFSGFVAGFLERHKKGSWFNLVIVGLMVSIIRLPVLLFVYRVGGKEIFGVMMVSFASGGINAWIRVRTGNVIGSIIARVIMNVAALT